MTDDTRTLTLTPQERKELVVAVYRDEIEVARAAVEQAKTDLEEMRKQENAMRALQRQHENRIKELTAALQLLIPMPPPREVDDAMERMVLHLMVKRHEQATLLQQPIEPMTVREIVDALDNLRYDYELAVEPMTVSKLDSKIRKALSGLVAGGELEETERERKGHGPGNSGKPAKQYAYIPMELRP